MCINHTVYFLSLIM
uniref:Uncharacterized protein n=1 Tax=Anguilla anguilla TaxID=7936 RepID=A0A0E9XNI0_ANGAN